MKLLFSLFIIVTLLGLNNCASNSELLNGYSSLLIFSHEGEEYKIFGFSPNETVGYNYLIKQENNEILIKCIDKQQDGTLDEVIVGDISLKEANSIYREAILTASASGFLKEKYFENYYITSDKQNIFEVRTYALADGDIYNFFAVKDINDEDDIYIARDLLANGNLDYFEEGDGDIRQFQSFYDEVIEKGIQDDKIKVSKGTYRIVK